MTTSTVLVRRSPVGLGSYRLVAQRHLSHDRARWTPKTMLDVPCNPICLGQLPFRGAVHARSHEPMMEPELFDRVQALLKE